MAQPQQREPGRREVSSSLILNALRAAGYTMREAQTMFGVVAVLRNPAATQAQIHQRMGEYMNMSLRASADICRMAGVWRSVAPQVSNPESLTPEQARQIAKTID